MSIDARLQRIMPGLSARERATLVLRSWKEHSTEDRSLRRSMPPAQVDEFNRLIGLMNGCNLQLGVLVMMLKSNAEKLELHMSWLLSLRLWEMNLAEIECAAATLVHEPITSSEHETRMDRASSQYVPVKELARVLATEQRAWTDDELYPVPWLGDLLVKDDAWTRLCGEAETELRRAAQAGELEAKGNGPGLRIRRGSFDQWMGRPGRLQPEWADAYEVRPDAEARRVDADRRTLALLRDALTQTPLAGMQGDAVAEHERTLPGLIAAVERGLKLGLESVWQECRAVESVVEAIAPEFGGEDPLKPLFREDLLLAKESLLRTGRELAIFGVVVDLPEPDDEELEGMWELVRRGA